MLSDLILRNQKNTILIENQITKEGKKVNDNEELAKEFTDEKTGIHYTLHENWYYLPDYELPEQGPVREIGTWGKMRKKYLKEHHEGQYTYMLTTCTLGDHLADINEQAIEMEELLTKQMKAAQGVTEELKANDPMKWVGMVNNIKSAVKEIIMSELIYS